MDQARELRKIMADKNKLDYRSKNPSSKKAKVVSVSSGKGGVGKTNFTVNLAIGLKRLGYEVLIIDADIGLGNVEIITGISMENSLRDVIDKNRSILNIIEDGPESVKLISGGSGLEELALLNRSNLKMIMEEISILETKFDYILIDTGAGISNSVMDFIMATDSVVIITTPDPTSIMDSYVLIKSLNKKSYLGDISIVSNLVKNSREGEDIFKKISGVLRQFLKMEIGYLGYVVRDDNIVKSVRNQIPFMIKYPNRKVSKQIEEIANRLISGEEFEEEGFAEKLLNVFFGS